MRKNKKTKLKPPSIAHQYYGYQRNAWKDSSTSSYQDPFPSLCLIDETREEWRKVTTTSEKEAIDRYVRTPFVCEILEESETVIERLLAE